MSDTTAQQHIWRLYSRAGFGLSAAEWEARRTWTTQRALDELVSAAVGESKRVAARAGADYERRAIRAKRALHASQRDPDRDEPAELIDSELKGGDLMYQMRGDWVRRMVDPGVSDLRERMVLFWHDHFACVPNRPDLAYAYLSALRGNAMGSFADLLTEVSKTTAMLRFLDAKSNTRERPNENFAREVMELFTLGVGHFSEGDVREASRAFTGWKEQRGAFVFNPRQHDGGEKTILGQSGNFDGDAVLQLLLDSPRTAEYLTEKLWRYFTGEKVDDGLRKRLAGQFRASGYDVGSWVASMLGSEEFRAVGGSGPVRSPVELFATACRQLSAELPEHNYWVNYMRRLQQLLLMPPSVAGWPAGEAWLTTSSLPMRAALGSILLGTLTPPKPLDYRITGIANGYSLRGRDAAEHLLGPAVMARQPAAGSGGIRDLTASQLTAAPRYHYA